VIPSDAEQLKFLRRLAEVCWVWQVFHTYALDGVRTVPAIIIRDLWETTSQHILFLTPERVEMLNTAFVEGRPEWGLRLWACRVRREKPGLHVVISDPKIAAMFAAVEDVQQVRPFVEKRADRLGPTDRSILVDGQYYGPTMTPLIWREPHKPGAE